MQSPWPCVNSARSGGQGGSFATGIWVMQQFAMENEACIMVYLFMTCDCSLHTRPICEITTGCVM